MEYTIKNSALTVTVTDEGGSMRSVVFDGEERLWQGGAAWAGRDVVIFPIVGHAGEYTVCGNRFAPRSHGVARYARFAVKERGEDFITLSLNSDEETKKTYPYDFTLEVGYKLSGASLTVSYFVKSARGVIPFYIGGHPGIRAKGGEAVIEFNPPQNPVLYPLDGADGVQLVDFTRFVANKSFFRECKTFQLGGIDGEVVMTTADGYRYIYKSDCPVYAFWSNEEEGDYVCVEPWWGINDFPAAPRELSLKPFINFASPKGKKFSYTLTIEKS